MVSEITDHSLYLYGICGTCQKPSYRYKHFFQRGDEETPGCKGLVLLELAPSIRAISFTLSSPSNAAGIRVSCLNLSLHLCSQKDGLLPLASHCAWWQ